MLAQASNTILMQHGWRGVAVPLMLLASLACNIIAISIPFLQLDPLLESASTYSLPNSVKLLWQEKLYVVSVLVAIFSISFPFVKLFALAGVWGIIRGEAARRRVLAWLTLLGKWSFLDVFIVVIMLVLTNNQLLVDAEPRPGLYWFMSAILLSMMATAWLDRITRPPIVADPGPRRALFPSLGSRGWSVTLLLALAVAALVTAITLPFLRISDLFLADHAYSVMRSIEALRSEHAPVLTIVTTLTLIICPLLWAGTLLLIWFLPLGHAGRQRWQRVFVLLGQCAMLDVFGVALLLFMLEGDALITTQVKPGLIPIVGLIVLLPLLRAVVNRADRRACAMTDSL